MYRIKERLSGTKFSWLLFEGDKTITRMLKTVRYLISGDSRRWVKLGGAGQ